VEAACACIDSYLRGALSAAECANTIQWIPNTHPMRWTAVAGCMTDRVLDTANAIRAGNRDAETLQTFCVDLRAGKAEMMATGWWPTMHGNPQVEAWNPGGVE
jgi:hypothetical protein